MTESQKQFEEWAKENLKCDLSHNGDHYNHSEAYYAWKGWQASRAALVVKLPENIDFPVWVSGDVIDGYKSALCDVRDALDVAGVRYGDF